MDGLAKGVVGSGADIHRQVVVIGVADEKSKKEKKKRKLCQTGQLVN